MQNLSLVRRVAVLWVPTKTTAKPHLPGVRPACARSVSNLFLTLEPSSESNLFLTDV